MREDGGFEAFYAGTSRRIVGQVLASVADLDAEALAWLRRACDENS
jgi:hypothetical protein